jgi:hypothetical protein
VSNTSKISALSVAVVWAAMLLYTFTEYLTLVIVSKPHPTSFTKYLTVLAVHTFSEHASKLIVTVTWLNLLVPLLGVCVLADFIP